MRLCSRVTVRLYDPEIDYAMLCRWWKEREQPPRPESWLSKEAFVVLERRPIAAGFFDPAQSSNMLYFSQFVTAPALVPRHLIQSRRAFAALLGKAKAVFPDRQIVAFPPADFTLEPLITAGFEHICQSNLMTWPRLS